ncbi:MAG TPA: S26 family signal peptidase, partial [Geobacterales bacterium]|nr:S26 family signal peptidase [Geobacterales bacterium]
MPSPFMNLLAIGAIIFLCYTFYRNREMTESIVVALILAFAIRTYIVQPFKIPSGSMEDTLLVGDYLLVNKFIYGTKVPLTDGRLLPIRQPKRG